MAVEQQDGTYLKAEVILGEWHGQLEVLGTWEKYHLHWRQMQGNQVFRRASFHGKRCFQDRAEVTMLGNTFTVEEGIV